MALVQVGWWVGACKLPEKVKPICRVDWERAGWLREVTGLIHNHVHVACAPRRIPPRPAVAATAHSSSAWLQQGAGHTAQWGP